MSEEKDEEYEPYGPEWQAEIMQFDKAGLVKMCSDYAKKWEAQELKIIKQRDLISNLALHLGEVMGICAKTHAMLYERLPPLSTPDDT